MSRGDIHDLVTSIDGLGFEVERLVEIHRAMAIDHLGRDPVGHLYEDDDVVPDQDHDPQPPAWVTGSEARGDEPADPLQQIIASRASASGASAPPMERGES